MDRMGSLTGYLQERFRAECPPGWECQAEFRLLTRELEAILGYAPRADVLLAERAGGRRLWIEFEVSRADPVANHAKFATGHLVQPQAPQDFFVAMVSRHVVRGRRNLAANTIQLMRHVGMQAVQTVLFPALDGLEVQRLNQMSKDDLRKLGPDVQPEIERALAVTTPQGAAGDHRIYLAGEVVEVLLNAQAWNREVATTEGRKLWGRRRVQYFVAVPYSGLFAPCKFCAFLPVGQAVPGVGVRDEWRMTLQLYVELDESEPRFDGYVAQRHLTKRLGMVAKTRAADSRMAALFDSWLTTVADTIIVQSRGPVFLLPPDP
jgi:hypothetical protein